VDFLFHPDADLWVDHHQTSIAREEWSELLNTPPFLPGDKILKMFPRRKTDFSEIVTS
jgi:hypothetical protein